MRVHIHEVMLTCVWTGMMNRLGSGSTLIHVDCTEFKKLKKDGEARSLIDMPK